MDYENGNRAHGSHDDVQRDHLPQRLACIRLILRGTNAGRIRSSTKKSTPP